MKTALSFDDVLLEPQHSEILSRRGVDVGVNLGVGVELDIPIIASPMDTVSGKDMALAMINRGGMAIVHRYNTIEEQASYAREAVRLGADLIGAAIPASGDCQERASALYEAGVNFFCIDIAHGHRVLGQLAAKGGDAKAAGGHFGRALEAAAASRLLLYTVVVARDWKRAVPESGAVAGAAIDAACAKMGKSWSDLAPLL